MFRSEAGTVKSADSEPGHHSDCGLAFQSSRHKDRHTIEVRLHACTPACLFIFMQVPQWWRFLDKQFLPVLRIRVRDPVPLWPLDPGWKKILKFFDADPNPGSGILSTLDSGSRIRDLKLGSGIRDKHPDPTTLVLTSKTLQLLSTWFIFKKIMPALLASLYRHSVFRKYIRILPILLLVLVLEKYFFGQVSCLEFSRCGSVAFLV